MRAAHVLCRPTRQFPLSLCSITGIEIGLSAVVYPKITPAEMLKWFLGEAARRGQPLSQAEQDALAAAVRSGVLSREDLQAAATHCNRYLGLPMEVVRRLRNEGIAFRAPEEHRNRQQRR